MSIKVKEIKNIIGDAKDIANIVKKIISSKHKLIKNPSNTDKEFLDRVNNELNQGIRYIKNAVKDVKYSDIIFAVDMFSNASITINQLKNHGKSNIGKNEKFVELCLCMDKLYEKTAEYA